MTYQTPMSEHIQAIDRLNSWVRSESFRQQSLGRPMRAIYFLKREAIVWADANLVCQHENVRSMVTCWDCQGTGKYTDSYGAEWPHCRRCSSKGRHYLMFVETRIEGGPTWHTPWQKFWIPGKLTPPYELFRIAFDWQPQTPGKDMTPDEVARDLNIVEKFFTNRPGEYHTDWGGPFDDFKYKLYVGRTENVCAFCGEPSEECGYGVSRGRLSWSDHACKFHAELYGAHKSADIFNRFPLPQHLISHPNILEWIERNNGRA